MGSSVDPRSADGTLGIYMHIPFCEHVCPYCDFAVVGMRSLHPADEQRYVDALLLELERRRGDWQGRRLATLYLGGGTPSLLREDSVAQILQAATAAFPAADDLEVTLEVNPSSVERERLPGFRAAGVNRLSLGVQSFDDRKLRALGRAHRSDECWETLRAAREAGFGNVSIDLMFRAPGETMDELLGDIESVLAAEPDHISAYELTIEPDTPFFEAAARGGLPRRDDDEAAAMIERVERDLSAAGFLQYELASYTRPGYESAHNRRYWERSAVLGLGLGAWSSHLDADGSPYGGRRANVRGLEEYLRRLEAGALPDLEVELLDAATARGEAMFLGLRCSEGVDDDTFAAEFGAPPSDFYDVALGRLVEARLLVRREPGSWVLTPRGRLLADSVGEHFV